MKKYLILSVLVLAMLVFGTTSGNAFCIQLENFCDRLEVFIDIDGNAYGRWDWRCDGTDLEEMLGQGGKNAIVAGYIGGVAKTESWRFNVPAKTVDVWQFLDGGTVPPTLLVTAGQPFTITGPNCGFDEASAGQMQGLPALND